MMPHDAAIFYNKKYIYFLLKNFVYTCYEVCTFNIGVTSEGMYIEITSLMI